MMAAGDLADGTYTADYLILKAENDSVSMANDYWEKPATVTIKDGKATVRVTINHSFWVTEFKVPGSGGAFVNTKVVSSNKKADTRLVEFPADITKPILSKIHVTVEEIDYDHDYTIRFVFDHDSFKLVKGAAPAQTAATKPSNAATTKPTATAEPATVPAAKPTTTEPIATAEPAQSNGLTGSGSGSSGQSATGVKLASGSSAAAQPAAAPTDSDSAVEPPPSATATTAAGEGGTEESSASPASGRDDTDSGENGEGAAEQGAGAAEVEESAAEGDLQSKGGDATESGDKAGDGDVQLADGDVPGGEAVTALAAGETTEAPVEEKGGSGLVWWTPIAAVLVLGAGAFFIWKRKVR
ncbi:heme uptake protein IsdC [Paenibacillus sp. PAMC21692]|nr:heme uptake protein IsdC [Paenibacillus sp. PAMC21692]